MRTYSLLLAALAASFVARGAWAQSALGGSASGAGNYGLSSPGSGGGFGGFSRGKDSGSFGTSRGIDGSSATTGAFSAEGGLSTDMSSLPSLGAPPPSSAIGNGPPGPPGRPVPGSTGVTP
jgi:hypothetical protein